MKTLTLSLPLRIAEPTNACSGIKEAEAAAPFLLVFCKVVAACGRSLFAAIPPARLLFTAFHFRRVCLP